ncbi:MAG: DoxX family protein [Parcubacteria group bacterium]|nr:DoxX family protein [Parcubacteria group bacterium]
MTKTQLWIGRIMSGVAVLFLAFDSITKIMRVKSVTDAMAAMGLNPNLALPIGITLLVCLLLYMMPRTAFFGALLLTAYLGGAVATNVIIAAPAYNLIFPVITAVFVWGGLYVTSAHVRALVGKRINA